jgi:NAD(P)-dependent dehydrogenase (short-subunit alcohol dehydrogenase family)
VLAYKTACADSNADLDQPGRGDTVAFIDQVRYDGRRALVVGGATGMGAAAASIARDLGAEVIVIDHAAVDYSIARAIEVDLRDRSSVDAALAQLDEPFDAVFCAAGVADGTAGLMKINFLSHRRIIETLVGDGRVGPGGAVCMISSVAGLGWQSQMQTLNAFLELADDDDASRWIEENQADNYGFSKQAINCYVARRAYPFTSKGVRINAICPGPTDTPLAQANAEQWLGFAQGYRDVTGAAQLTPEQMANVMVFLNSDAASGISGVNLLVDSGHVMSSLSGSYAPDQPVIEMIMTISTLGYDPDAAVGEER